MTCIGALVRVGFSLDGWLSTAIRQVHPSYARKYAGCALALHLSTVKALDWLHCEKACRSECKRARSIGQMGIPQPRTLLCVLGSIRMGPPLDVYPGARDLPRCAPGEPVCLKGHTTLWPSTPRLVRFGFNLPRRHDAHALKHLTTGSPQFLCMRCPNRAQSH